MVQKTKEEGGLKVVFCILILKHFQKEFIIAWLMNGSESSDNIIVARAYNSAHQTLILEAGPIIEENNIKLIVADSAVGLFRSEYWEWNTI